MAKNGINIKHIPLELTIKFTRTLKIRMWVGMMLFRLAGLIMGKCSLEFKE